MDIKTITYAFCLAVALTAVPVAAEDFDMMDRLAANAIKKQLNELCEGEAACESDLEQQYDACIRQSDFLAYMNSPEEEEDALLDKTYGQLTDCIVDKDGVPHFTYDETK